MLFAWDQFNGTGYATSALDYVFCTNEVTFAGATTTSMQMISAAFTATAANLTRITEMNDRSASLNYTLNI